jgi:hypothetical protein
MSKSKAKKIGSPGVALNIIDAERFPKIREAFTKRGMGGLNLSAMIRIVIDEWMNTAKKAGN